MIAPCVYEHEAAIRELIVRHLHELVREQQEVRITYCTLPSPLVGILRGYEPPARSGEDAEYADTLWIYPGGDSVLIFTPSKITRFEVLGTKRMTPEVAYQQMKEMERAGGLLSLNTP